VKELIEDVEVVEDIDVTKAIIVTQKPIITYDELQKISDEVVAKIASLEIDKIESTEENLKLSKSTRTSVKKSFEDLERIRLKIKDTIMKPYNDMNEVYDKLIASVFNKADTDLKKIVDTIETRMLNEKIDGLIQYFKDENKNEFVKFEDVGLKVIRSKSDKFYQTIIDEYLANIKMSIATIETLSNKERVLAKFQMSKDLNRSISETNIEIQREEQIKAQNAEREQLEAERKQRAEEAQRIAQQQRQESEDAIVAEVLQANPQLEKQEPQPMPEDQVYKASFTVYATKAQLSELKKFMSNTGVKYE
jgi:hypothetical protein